MKTKNTFLAMVILLLAYCLLPIATLAQSRDVPFTLEDRDRIIQMNEKLNSQQTQTNDVKTELSAVKQEIKDVRQEIKDVRQEIKDVKQEILNLFYWGFGIMLSLMLFLLGFIIWDRRTAMEPVRERTQSLIQSLREYAKEQPKLAEILRSHGLL